LYPSFRGRDFRTYEPGPVRGVKPIVYIVNIRGKGGDRTGSVGAVVYPSYL